jgi:hypothetical protein
MKDQMQHLPLARWEKPQCRSKTISDSATIDGGIWVSVRSGVMTVTTPDRGQAPEDIAAVLTGGAPDDTEQPCSERGVAPKDGPPIEHLEIRILQHVAGLTSIEPTTGHGPAHAFGVVPFERRSEIGGRRYRRVGGFRNANECQGRRIHMTARGSNLEARRLTLDA